MTTVRLGIIGCGRIAQVAHLPAIEKAEGVTVTAVCDGNPEVAEAVARRYDIPAVHKDAGSLLADDSVDAVIVAIPDRFHRDIVSTALRAGKHVLVEKPLAATEDECRELAAIAAATGLKLQVASMKRHDQGVEYAKAFVEDGLGELRSFNAWYRIGDLRPGIEHTLFPRVYSNQDQVQGEAAVKADRQRYLLATHGSHVFDTVRFLCGPIVAIDARHTGFGRDHMWQCLVRTKGGVIGTMTITVDVPGAPSEGIELFGSRGTARVDIPFPFTKQASKVSVYADGQVVTPLLTDGDAYERQVESFAEAIRTDSDPVPNAADGLAAVRAIAACAESAEQKAEVQL